MRCSTRVTGNDEAVIIYTSGTTSVPKGVIHLHSIVIKEFRWQAMIYARHVNRRIASPFPLFWSAGVVSVLGSTRVAGGPYVGDEVVRGGRCAGPYRARADRRVVRLSHSHSGPW
jgi:acyl-coenzyme A synthetase/AMP-(fatty) acid ligase